MARTPLGDLLDHLLALQHVSRRTGIPTDELSDVWAERAAQAPVRIDRRDFLRTAGRFGTAAALATPALAALAACTPVAKQGPPAGSPGATGGGRDGPRIAIVGAGLAGMTAALRLHQAGFSSTVYEASERAGGRTRTLRGFFDNDETAELCGEYINSDHKAIRSLAAELGLMEDNLWSYYPRGVHGLLYFDGKPYSHQDMAADLEEVFPKILEDRLAAGWPTTYDTSTPAGVKLDNTTLAEWVERNVPGGRKSRFGKLIEVGYAGEYGLDIEDQSSLNLMFEAGFSSKNNPRLYGNQDWKWRIAGGNDLVATTIADDQLPAGTVELGSPLVAVRRNGDETTTLTFEPDGGSPTDVTADIVVMTAPFTALRAVDLDKAGWSELKRKTINELGMGTNSKLHLQFDEQVWHASHLSGDVVCDLPIQSLTVVYPIHGSTGILDNYTGGTAGASYPVSASHAPAPEAVSQAALKDIEVLIHGATEAWNGKAYLSFMVADPWALGSYSCPTPGEYSTIFGAAKLPEGKVLFAGEHTSLNFFGFMNGAVETGERAAREALATMGAQVPASPAA
ncbi:MAG: NAD(P)/FAD-dependent oxidoreductase [Actinomycetota bacterium]